MKAAIVTAAGKLPVYADFMVPQAAPGEVAIDVTAAALSHVTKARAAGTHYTSSQVYPFVAGLDGVGRRQDGARAYFLLPRAPFGGMADRTVVNAAHCVSVPDALDDVTAAAIANPGMSSWAALKERAGLRPGETVLINGATGSSGRLAVQIARLLGAKKIIATGRDRGVLKSLAALGADLTISLLQDDDALDAVFQEQFGGDGVDIVLDYLWGPSAERLLRAAAKSGKETPMRFVQIGSISGQTIPAYRDHHSLLHLAADRQRHWQCSARPHASRDRGAVCGDGDEPLRNRHHSHTAGRCRQSLGDEQHRGTNRVRDGLKRESPTVSRGAF